MIDGFESITYDLTEEELGLVPIVLGGLKKRTTSDDAIHGKDICQKMTDAGYKMTEPRLRKITNYIRSNGLAPVIATSKGYYVSHNSGELCTQIASLEQRRNAIDQAIKGLKKFLP